MKTAELRQKTAHELKRLLADKEEKLGILNFDLASGKIKNIKEIRLLKKDIARILSLLKTAKSE